MWAYLLRLALALVAGFFVGIVCAREDRQKSSRDFAVIGLGSALIALLAVGIMESMDLPWAGDPLRMPAQIISALGFLGTGMIWIDQENRVQGIHAAAALWLTALLGLLIGSGMFDVSVIGIVFLLAIYWISHHLEAYTTTLRRFIVRIRRKKTI